MSSDSSPFTFTSLSLVLFEIEVLLGTLYMGGVYFPIPLIVLHPREEGGSETTMSSDPSPFEGGSR